MPNLAGRRHGGHQGGSAPLTSPLSRGVDHGDAGGVAPHAAEGQWRGGGRHDRTAIAGPTPAFAHHPNERALAWLDQPAESPEPKTALRRQLVWEHLNSWRTPTDKFFVVNHYNEPAIRAQDWRLKITGLVERSRSLTLAELKTFPRREVDFTLECSGNTGLDYFIGGIGNARWAGAPLCSVLKRSNIKPDGVEVVFWGADKGEVTIGDNTGVLGPGETGKIAPKSTELTITEHFARSMSLEDALKGDNLLCHEMNGDTLPRAHGYPVRLIAPVWYGVANVKWLTRIEVRDSRYQGRLMARDYVTFREEERGGETVWTFTSVSHDRLKSAPAKVTHQGDQYRIMGAAWGAPIAQVEVKIDRGPWRPARLRRHRTRNCRAGFAWVFWTLDWDKPDAGVHAIRSRAIDVHGNVQPAPDDPYLAGKVTYWESNGQITRRVRLP